MGVAGAVLEVRLAVEVMGVHSGTRMPSLATQ